MENSIEPKITLKNNIFFNKYSAINIELHGISYEFVIKLIDINIKDMQLEIFDFTILLQKIVI